MLHVRPVDWVIPREQERVGVVDRAVCDEFEDDQVFGRGYGQNLPWPPDCPFDDKPLLLGLRGDDVDHV